MDSTTPAAPETQTQKSLLPSYEQLEQIESQNVQSAAARLQAAAPDAVQRLIEIMNGAEDDRDCITAAKFIIEMAMGKAGTKSTNAQAVQEADDLVAKLRTPLKSATAP